MANFGSYDRRDKQRKLLWGGGIAAMAGVLIASPGARVGLAKFLMGSAQKLATKFRPRGLPTPLTHVEKFARQYNRLMSSQLHNAARDSIHTSEFEGAFRGALNTHLSSHATDHGSITDAVTKASHLRAWLSNSSRGGGDQFLLHREMAGIQQQFGGQRNEIQQALEFARNQVQKSGDAYIQSPQFQAAAEELRGLAATRLGELSRDPAQRRFLTANSATAWMQRKFGIESVTLGQAGGRATPQTRDYLQRAFVDPHVLSQQTVGGVTTRTVVQGAAQDLSTVRMGGIYRVGGEEYDLRGFHQMYDLAVSSARRHFQIPLAPGAGGINPLTLAPWRHGRLPNEIAHIGQQAKDATLRNLFGSTDDTIGHDVFKVGNRYAAMQFRPGQDAHTATLFPEAELDLISGLHGYGRRRAEYIEAARTARAARAGQPSRMFGQSQPTLLDNVRSVRGKFDPQSNWIPSVVTRLLDGTAPLDAVPADQLKRVLGYLRSGPLSPETQRTVLSRLGNYVGNAGHALDVTTNEGLIKAFNDLAASTMQPANSPLGWGPGSKRLTGMLERWKQNPNALWETVEPHQDHSLFGWNFVGRRPDITGPDQMRQALMEEAIHGLTTRHGQDVVAVMGELGGLGLKPGELTDLRGLATANILERRMLGGTNLKADDIQGTVAMFRGSLELQQATSDFTARHAKPWHTYVEPTQQRLQTGELTIRRGRLLINEINQQMVAGADPITATWRAINAPEWQNQYRAFFTGNAADVTSTTAMMEYFPHKLNEYFTQFGMGLPDEDLLTGWSTVKNLMLKRALPALIGYEAYRYADFEADQWHVPGPSKAYAEIRSHVGLARARAFGDGGMLGDRSLYPGLEKLISDRTVDEEQRHQQGGWEEVRKGRFWMIGSKELITGGRISHYAPSAVAAARSNWQMTQDSDTNSSRYWTNSRLPNPANLFIGAVLNWIPDKQSYWWEYEHKDTRPVIQSSSAFDPQTPYGPLANATIGHLIKPERLILPEYVPRHMGGEISRRELTEINESLKTSTDRRDISVMMNGRNGPPVSMPGVVLAGIPGQSNRGLATYLPAGSIRAEQSPLVFSSDTGRQPDTWDATQDGAVFKTKGGWQGVGIR